MTASLTTTSAFLDLLTYGRRAPAQPGPIDAVARPAEAGVPLRRLRALREMLARRAERRALAAAMARLQETSPHLLDDIGLLGWDSTAPAGAPSEAAASLPEPGTTAVSGSSWRPTRMMRPLDIHARDDDRPSSAVGWRAERPDWNAPDHWLR